MMQRLCIIGVGLIGGSIAKAVRRQELCQQIVGVDADAENLRCALDLGIIDAAFAVCDLAEAAVGADWVVIATPVGAMPSALQGLQADWSDAMTVTDVGSTKQSAIAAAQAVFGATPANFVPGHPIAGAERSGVEAATDDLFVGKRVILTPVAETDPLALARVEQFWTAIGASVALMSPLHHDHVFAATSHLPHVLAYALVRLLGRMDEQEEIFQYAGAGFRDFTRIASSNPQMWADICLLNREPLIPLLGQLGAEISAVAEMMAQQSQPELCAYFTEAREARQRFLNQLETNS
jgi:prephenate dehydrogenase